MDVQCNYLAVCERFIQSLRIPDIYFDANYDQCHCPGCITARGDELYYIRGVPPKVYGLPLGWSRFGLNTPPQAIGLKVFDLWHVAYHGTIPQNIQSIIESKDLLMPGDVTIDGKHLSPPAGHFDDDRKPRGFDIRQVFVSPTIAYAGHPVYARKQSWYDPISKRKYYIQVAFQLRIKPGSYQVGKETIRLGSQIIDAKFSNSELEWSTKARGSVILTGILVKTDMWE